MNTFLFIASFVLVLLMALELIKGERMPIPLLHHLDIAAGNCYLWFPALCYQVWFWFTYFGVI